MKRTTLTIITILILLPLCLGGFVLYQWASTTKEDMPDVVVTVQNKTVPETGYDWNQPVLMGLAYKHFKSSPSLEATKIGTVYDGALPVDFPVGFTSVVSLDKDDETVWVGVGEQWNEYALTENGEYIVNVTSTKEKQGANGYGVVYHRFAFTVQMDPAITLGGDRVDQGDVFAVRLENITDDLQPTIENEITTSVFLDSGKGTKTAYIPVTHNQEPGDYTATIRAGSYEWTVHFRVLEREFESQQLTIDVGDPVISEANSAEAYEEYRQVMYPIFAQYSEQRHWDGLFMQPVQDSEITTTYASRRYTNDASTATPHAGVDYSVPEGTHVHAPNGGQVVLAEYLLNTGWTLVVDHGGGLKSYFFHMNELYVNEGDTVRKGDIVGEVGSTGYSTGPHLHYEVRMLDKSIDPELLYHPESGLMLSEDVEEESLENTVEFVG